MNSLVHRREVGIQILAAIVRFQNCADAIGQILAFDRLIKCTAADRQLCLFPDLKFTREAAAGDRC